MKGFYFSLDALLASSVILAAFIMVMSQPVDSSPQLESYKLDRVHLASMQSIAQWNSTYGSERKVSSAIVKNYYGGNRSKARQICANYFNPGEKYAVYISNKTSSKVCGSYNVKPEDSLIAETGFIPDTKINGSFTGSLRLTMVIKD